MTLVFTFEAVFANNHLAPFLPTHDLKPQLYAAVAAAPPGSIGVIAVSSTGHPNSPGLDFDDLQGNAIDLDPGVAYCHAKLAKPAETLGWLATDPEGPAIPVATSTIPIPLSGTKGGWFTESIDRCGQPC